MNQKNKILTLILVLILLLFYWFQYRPSQIRKDCSSIALEQYDSYSPYYKTTYDACLQKQGLAE